MLQSGVAGEESRVRTDDLNRLLELNVTYLLVELLDVTSIPCPYQDLVYKVITGIPDPSPYQDFAALITLLGINKVFKYHGLPPQKAMSNIFFFVD